MTSGLHQIVTDSSWLLCSMGVCVCVSGDRHSFISYLPGQNQPTCTSTEFISSYSKDIYNMLPRFSEAAKFSVKVVAESFPQCCALPRQLSRLRQQELGILSQLICQHQVHLASYKPVQLPLSKLGYQGSPAAPSPFPLPSPPLGCASAVKAGFPASRWPKVGAAQRERPSIPYWGRGASFKTCLEKLLLVPAALLLSCSPALLSETILIFLCLRVDLMKAEMSRNYSCFFPEQGFQASKLYLTKLESAQDAE